MFLFVETTDIKDMEKISKILSELNKHDINKFLSELLTNSEAETLSKRWRIMQMLAESNHTQREIAKDLGVSLCKVTRGAKILKTPNSISKKILERENHAKHNTKQKQHHS